MWKYNSHAFMERQDAILETMALVNRHIYNIWVELSDDKTKSPQWMIFIINEIRRL